MNWRAFPLLFRLSSSRHTDAVVNSFSAAWKLAALRGHASISPDHLLAGMATVGRRRPLTILARLDLSLDLEALAELNGPA